MSPRERGARGVSAGRPGSRPRTRAVSSGGWLDGPLRAPRRGRAGRWARGVSGTPGAPASACRVPRGGWLDGRLRAPRVSARTSPRERGARGLRGGAWVAAATPPPATPPLRGSVSLRIARSRAGTAAAPVSPDRAGTPDGIVGSARASTARRSRGRCLRRQRGMEVRGSGRGWSGEAARGGRVAIEQRRKNPAGVRFRGGRRARRTVRCACFPSHAAAGWRPGRRRGPSDRRGAPAPRRRRVRAGGRTEWSGGALPRERRGRTRFDSRQ
jgi:hypothetical protein